MRAARQFTFILVAGRVFGGMPAAGGEPARQVFGAQVTPSAGPAEPHGSYAGGCLAGAVALPETGPGWQAMRLSRNRNWGFGLRFRGCGSAQFRVAKGFSPSIGLRCLFVTL